MPKPKVGLFSFTCCEGCLVTLMEAMNENWKNWFKKMDISEAKLLKSKNKTGKMDLAFVEGAISTRDEEKKIKEIRKNAKKVVALGSCAINGWPSNLRNSFDAEKTKAIKPFLRKFNQLDKVYPVSEFIKVDCGLPGCPVAQEDLEKYIKQVLKNA